MGEATVEVSAYFLGRILGLTTYLNQAHLVKQGMRFWFFNQQSSSLEDCSEIGGRYLARLAAYQVDRSTLDEEILRRAKAMGAEILRPASVHQEGWVPGWKESNGRRGRRIRKRRPRQVEELSSLLVPKAAELHLLGNRNELLVRNPGPVGGIADRRRAKCATRNRSGQPRSSAASFRNLEAAV